MICSSAVLVCLVFVDLLGLLGLLGGLVCWSWLAGLLGLLGVGAGLVFVDLPGVVF